MLDQDFATASHAKPPSMAFAQAAQLSPLQLNASLLPALARLAQDRRIAGLAGRRKLPSAIFSGAQVAMAARDAIPQHHAPLLCDRRVIHLQPAGFGGDDLLDADL